MKDRTARSCCRYGSGFFGASGSVATSADSGAFSMAVPPSGKPASNSTSRRRGSKPSRRCGSVALTVTDASAKSILSAPSREDTRSALPV